jgi:hypothetical protein
MKAEAAAIVPGVDQNAHSRARVPVKLILWLIRPGIRWLRSNPPLSGKRSV